jgi:hypothetical protein
MQANDSLGLRFNLRDMHILMTVVQAGSMSKAAKVLNTVQPVVSRSIAELEYALGVRLTNLSRYSFADYWRVALRYGWATSIHA